MSINTTNYKDVYSWSTPAKIVGQSTLKTIDNLEATLKKNATKTHTTLSDGTHGHLGLVLAPNNYALISNAPYIQPQLPAPLVIPPATTQVQAANLKDIHQRATNLFYEVKQVKAQLISQIEEAIEEDFLRGMIHPDTSQLQGEIWEILDMLKSATRTSDEELEAHRNSIKNMDFNPSMPVDTVFNRINKFITLSRNAGKQISQPQAIALAMLVLKKTGVFSRHIVDWNHRPTNQRTWLDFKNFFRQAQNELRDSNSLTSQEALIQMNANMVAQQVTDNLLQHPVFHMDASETPAPAPTPTPAPSEAPPVVPINNAANTPSMESMMQQMLQMMLQQQQLPPQQPYQPYYRSGGGRGNYYRGGRGGGRGRGRGPIIFNKYCWTHGLCTHSSQECRNRANGHKENATLTNQMGGSTRNL